MTRVRVDELDCRLLKALFTGGTFFWRSDRILLYKIAEDLQVHRNTLLNRLRRLEETGAFLPLAPSVPARALGLRAARLLIDPPGGNLEDAVDRICAVEGVFRIVINEGAWSVTLAAEDERSLSAAARLVRLVAPSTTTNWESFDAPPSARTTQPFDATATRIVAQLLRNPQAELESTAAALSLSPRTIARQVERLRASGALVMRPTRGGLLEGMAFAAVRLEAAGDIAPPMLAAIQQAAPDYYFRHVVPRNVHLYLYATSHDRLAEQISRLRALPGAARLDVRRHLGFYPNPDYSDWAARLLERRAAWSATPKGEATDLER